MDGAINLAAKLASFDETWAPRIIAELNEQHVKVVRLHGEYVWHKHETEDELFLVVKGELELRLRDRTIVLREGELFVVPRGVEHLPVAESEAHVLLFEPVTIRAKGDDDA